VLKLATPGKTSGTNVGYQVCPKVREDFAQSSLMVACLNLNKPMLPVPEVAAFTSVFPKKSPSIFPETFALNTSGPLNFTPILDTTDKKLLEPVAFLSSPLVSFATSRG